MQFKLIHQIIPVVQTQSKFQFYMFKWTKFD